MALSNAKKQYYETRLTLYLEAEQKILNGQAYKIGTRSVARADLPAVQSEVRRLETLLANNGIRSRTLRIVPRDL